MTGFRLDAQPTVVGAAKQYRENTGRMKVSSIQNIFEADFEYSTQLLRWEIFTNGTGAVQQLPGLGGVQMTIGTDNNAIAIRQSRAYHRYQPGKTMAMATAANFGGAVANQRQRIGFFDDGNGIFFEQADPTTQNPLGMFAVYRSDVNQVPVDVRVPLNLWTDPQGVASNLIWTNIQMLYIEYTWYGAGVLRWGVLINGEPCILHEQAVGNNLTGTWSRTGNLPVRYELRNIAAVTTSCIFYHYGVSVLVDGGQDPQRGFTYSYGMATQVPLRTVAQNVIRYPLTTFRPRVMGTQEFTQASAAITGVPTTTSMTVASLPSITSITVSGTTATVVFSAVHNITAATAPINNYMNLSGAVPAALNGYQQITVVNTTTVSYVVPSGTASATTVGTATPWYANQWVGRKVFFPGVGSSGQGIVALITANTTTTLTYQDLVIGYNGYAAPIAAAPSAAGNYTIGQIDRGLILPQTLIISSTAICTVEIILSTANNPITLTGATFTPLNSLGSFYSFAERDVSATALSGGEVVMTFGAPAGGSGLQTFDLKQLFPLYNTIRGNQPDFCTVAITTPSGTSTTAGAYVLGQEQMS
jgi:hypothetical protein